MFVLSFEFKCYSLHIPGNNRPKYNLYHADFEKMRDLLSNIDWYGNLTSLSIHKAWEFFTIQFNDILDKCIPLIKQRKKKNVYVSSDVLHLKNHRNKLWKKYVTTKSVDDFRRYSMVRNELRTLTRTLRSDYERNLTLNIKNNPKLFGDTLILDLKFIPQSMISSVLMAPLHILIETKQKHLTTSLLMYSLKKTYHRFPLLLWTILCLLCIL